MKKFVSLFLIVSMCILYAGSVQAAVLRRGSNGQDVRTVQQKLKTLGYYGGNVDGIFGPITEAAVKNFQRSRGLTVDGIVGPNTAKALGISLTTTNSGDVYLIARTVYGEGRGEAYIGKVAIAAVILNRVDSPLFPNTIAGVIYQPGAFSVVADGQINLAPDEESIRAARDAMAGYDPTYGCLYYYNPAKTTNQWMLSKPVVITIGNHKFFR